MRKDTKTEEAQPDVTEPVEKQGSFLKELTDLINRHGKESGSDTPDFVLAGFLNDCRVAFDKAVSMRSDWYGLKEDD